MKTTQFSITEMLAEIKPVQEFHDAGQKDQLFFLPAADDSPFCVLNRPLWQIIRKTEPGISYSTWVLEAAMRRSETEGCRNILLHNCDKARGLSYIVSIRRVWALGVKKGNDYNLRITLPLRYWDKLHSDGRITRVDLPEPTEEQLGNAIAFLMNA